MTTTARDMIIRACEEVQTILLAKNRKYGNSALEPMRVFSKASAIEQLNVRIDDKLSRLASKQPDEDEDVELDLIGYLILRRVARALNAEAALERDVAPHPTIHTTIVGQGTIYGDERKPATSEVRPIPEAPPAPVTASGHLDWEYEEFDPTN